MASEKDIENLIRFLDSKTESGISRINVQTTEELKSGNITQAYHHGRCDVGSPWAKGTVKNFDCVDKQ